MASSSESSGFHMIILVVFAAALFLWYRGQHGSAGAARILDKVGITSQTQDKLTHEDRDELDSLIQKVTK